MNFEKKNPYIVNSDMAALNSSEYKKASLSLSLFLSISFFLMQTQQVAENHTHRYLWNEKVKGIIFISPIPFENFYTLWSNHSYNSCTFKLL